MGGGSKLKVDSNSIRRLAKKLERHMRNLSYRENDLNDYFCGRVIHYMKRNLKENNNVHTNLLIDTIRSRYSDNFGGCIIEMVEYWRYIEYGTLPHNVPTNERIIRWVSDKYIPYLSGKKTLAQSVYLFIQHVREYGTQPYPFVRSAIKRALADTESEFPSRYKGKVKIVRR